MKKFRETLVVAVTSCVLTACGGGANTGDPEALLLPHPTDTTAGPLAALASPPPRRAETVRTPDATAFFNWAEVAFPALLSAPQANKSLGVWTYRYYPNTDIFLGVNTDGDVLGLVGTGGGAYNSVGLGKLSGFGCSVYPSDCVVLPPPPPPPPPPIGLTASGELADTPSLPQPPANSRPMTATHDPQVESELVIGAYKFGRTTVMMFGGVEADCPSFGASLCPYFVRARVDLNGRFTIDSFAYFPKSNKWVELNARDDFKIGNGEMYGTSAGWSTIPFSPTTATSSLKNGRRYYLYGSASFQLGVNAKSIAGTTIPLSTPAGGTHSQSAKSFEFSFELVADQYVELSKGGFWSGNNRESSDDPRSYKRLADLRTAHTSSPLCLHDALDAGNGVVFNELTMGAIVYTIPGVCRSTIAQNSALSVIEGVTSVADKKLILLQQPSYSPVGTTSGSQYVLAIGLTDGGIVARGKAYRSGFIKSQTGYFNEVAFIDWMKTQYLDAIANSFPK